MREIGLLLSDISGRNITRTRSCWTRSRKLLLASSWILFGEKTEIPLNRGAAPNRLFEPDSALHGFCVRLCINKFELAGNQGLECLELPSPFMKLAQTIETKWRICMIIH